MSIVFLNYNRLDETKETVEKLLPCKDKISDLEIIAVDNGSTDGTNEYLLSMKDILVPVILDNNYGIAGYNRGFHLASGDIIIVLDDDSHIDADTVNRAVESFIENDSIGAVAFKILDSAGNRFNTWHIPSDDIYCESFAFVGCGFAIRRELFKKAGFYPEEFFLYHNEIYVAIRIRQSGYKIMYDPACIAVHRTSGELRDPSRRIYYTLKNSLYLIWMFYPLHSAIYLIVSRIIISFSLAAAHKKPLPFIGGFLDFLSALPKRDTLPIKSLDYMKPFFRQNSLLHRIGLFEF